MASRTPRLLHLITKAASAEAEGHRSAHGVGVGQGRDDLDLLPVPELPAHRTEHVPRTGEGVLGFLRYFQTTTPMCTPKSGGGAIGF